jgi:hypothetical protein
MELKQLKDLVTETLKQGETFRENDDLLYLTICIKLFSNRGSITNMTVSEFFTCRKRYGLPTYESVSRCRRKAQEENPALRPCKAIQKGREIQQERFYNFATKQGEFCF